MDVRSLAVEETSFLHLRDAGDELLYDNGQPVGITLYSPGTKTYAKAQQDKQNRMVDRVKKRGKADTTSEETIQQNAAFLAACTKSMQNIAIGELQGEELFMAVYSDTSIGFIADQAAKFLGEWANFTKGSTKT